MKIIGIYQIKNLTNGKIYVGQTRNYERREMAHFSSLERGEHHNEHLQRSYLKNGRDNFKCELLEKCKEEQLDEREIHYIQKLNCLSNQNGYNLMTGGQVYRKFTLETRMKMSESGKGRVFSEEHKQRISSSLKGRTITESSIIKCNETKTRLRIHQGETNPNAIISNKTAENIIVELLSMKSVNEVSLEFNVTTDIVYNLMYNRSYKDVMPEVRENLKNIIKNEQNNKYEFAIQMYLSGESQNEVSKKLKISRNTIRKILLENGIDTKIHKNQFVKQTNTEINN